MNMKKILFIVCACIAMTFASCGRCSKCSTPCNQDTLVVEDTVVEEAFDTLIVEE